MMIWASEYLGRFRKIEAWLQSNPYNLDLALSQSADDMLAGRCGMSDRHGLPGASLVEMPESRSRKSEGWQYARTSWSGL